MTKSLQQRAAENQTTSKATLSSIATLVAPIGVLLISQEKFVPGIIVVLIAIGCIVGRELLKLRR